MPVDSKSPLIIIHNYENFSVPARPDDPESYPQEDFRHWYDKEYAQWSIEKQPQPESPADGPIGKKVICNMPVTHPYHLAFRQGLKKIADLNDIQLEIYDTDWDSEAQYHFARMSVKKDPDLIIHINPTPNETKGIYKEIYDKGIPVIASNMVPDEEDLPYILTWTGPDDWGMSRALARDFARQMNYKGNYVLIQHMEGNSCNMARTWGIMTELQRIAPAMTCLDYTTTHMEEEKSYNQMKSWVREYGHELKGVVSADSLIVMKGVNKALSESGRVDMIRAAHWSPPKALDYIKHGFLHATTYQSGVIDGTLAMQTAVDWFNGFDIPPVRYMPIHIITKEDVDFFINRKNEYPILDYHAYMLALKTGDREGIKKYFQVSYDSFNQYSLITMDYLRGFSIEIVSRLISIIAEKGLNKDGILGCANPSMLANYLFHQKSFEKTMEWLEKISLDYCEAFSGELPGRTSIGKIVEYVDTHFNEGLSLKTLSYKFDLTAAYLGQIFRKQTGESFSVYLNKVRIEQAKKLLANKDLKEYEVARETGYTDASYFYRIFKKQTGMNPSEYREKTQ